MGEYTTTWDDGDDEESAAAGAAREPGDDPEPGDGPPLREPGSILADIAAATADLIEDDSDTKILQVGKHPYLRARYRVIGDEQRDQLMARAKAKFRTNARRRAGHQQKGGDSVAGAQVEEPKAERYFHALLLAAACVEILVEDADGTLTPLQQHLETMAPVTYNRSLAKIARLDESFGLDLADCSPADVVTALHTWGKERSTSPLDSRAQVLKLWMGQVDVDALEEAMGG